MVITMQDYDEIRRRFLAGESQRHIAKVLGISRNTVKKYCEGNAVPWIRKTPDRVSTVLTNDVLQFIQHCMDEDNAEGLKKQRHTAKRIFDRLVEEKGFTGGESTIRTKVQEIKQAIPKVFLPLEFDAGEAMQVDWGEATVYLQDARTKINIFCVRMCYSCMPFVFAYHKQNEESFLDAFVRVFNLLGGVPKKVIFDNGKVAVKDGFGKHAAMQQGYTMLSAHYSFKAIFCNPAQGHEKGLVEGLVGWSRRNILVPVPRVSSMKELNEKLLKRCIDRKAHTVKGKPSTIGTLLEHERTMLQPLPGFQFEIAKSVNSRVNAFSTVRFKTNNYSVPVNYAGKNIGLKAYPERIEIYYSGTLIAEHERCFAKHKTCYVLEHYMPLLMQRRRAIPNAAPVRHNVPPEVLEELQNNATDYSRMVEILQSFVEDDTPSIKDSVHIMPVDLHEYDHLGIGKEVTLHGKPIN